MFSKEQAMCPYRIQQWGRSEPRSGRLSRFTRRWAAVALVVLLVSSTRADDDAAVQQAIEQAAVKFVEAYNAKDAEAIAKLFGPEARVEEADGTVVEGRDDIQAAFTAVFENDPKAKISVTMDSIRLIKPDVAVEQGATEYFPDGETLTSRSEYLVVHLKGNEGWQMASVRSMNREVVSNYEYLRPLEWLVGDWMDEGNGSVVKTSCRWSENRNYLLQDFEVHGLAGVELKGTQRIGWDPQAKQIRSWIFDDSGAFGESIWTPSEGLWVVKMTAVSPDGETASATRRIEPVGEEHVLVTTTDRLLGAEAFPDSAVTMIRRPPEPRTAEAAQ
jgi:uncharacterized protein (TIGR02246 family)